jgi:hypothetical protein
MTNARLSPVQFMAAPQLSPAQFMATAPQSMNGNTEWASRYARDLRAMIIRQASFAPRSLQVHLGPSEIGEPCLSGDTEVVTRQGIRKISDLVGTQTELLVPLLYAGSSIRKRWGKFRYAPVACFGEQELFRVTLRRNQERKEVLATAEHRWFRSYWSGKQKKQECLTTAGLKPGHKLAQLRRAFPQSATLMPIAVAQGFVFGDGGHGDDSDHKHRAARLMVYAEEKAAAMRQFFPGAVDIVSHSPSDIENRGELPKWHVQLLPRFWKRLPPIDESTSFLLSWLAGYFAADGSVGPEDGHCSISSAFPENLEFVRDLAAVCGIGYGRITRSMRQGGAWIKNQEETPLYKLSLRRRDLPSWFFLLSHHWQRVQAANTAPERDPHWIVESVESTGRVEPVYCATVENAGAFALADDLMTGNCSRQIVGKLAGITPTNHVSDPWPSIVGTAVHAWLALACLGDNERERVLRWITEAAVEPAPGYGGHADLYDTFEQSVVDWKCLGPTSLSKIKSLEGPPQRYKIQLLLYGRGYRNLGLPVKRVAIAALPRTASTLDGMYVWSHNCTPDDDILLDEILRITAVRQEIAIDVREGRMQLNQVPATPEASACFFCPYYRPQSSYDGGPGCPGIATRAVLRKAARPSSLSLGRAAKKARSSYPPSGPLCRAQAALVSGQKVMK